MTAAVLQNANIRDFQDVSRLTPSFYFSDQIAQLRADRATRVYVMRGLAIASVATGESVLVFLDGAPVVGGGDVGTFANVDRVEVLRGPQAAYFGRNTYAGAINIVSKEPSGEFAGKLDAEYGRFQTASIGVALDGPIVEDRISARVTGRYEHKGGHYVNQADGSRLGTRNTMQLTSQLNVTPSDALKVRGYLGVFKFSDPPDARGLFLIPQRPCAVPGTVRVWFCGRIPNFPENLLAFNTTVDQRYIDNVFPRSLFGGDPVRRTGGSSTIAYQAHGIVDWEASNGMSVNAIAAWHDSKTTLISDEDARDTLRLPNTTANIARGARTFANELTTIDRYFKDWSVEARLTSSQESRLRFTAGASYVRGESVNSYVHGDSITGIRTIPSTTGRIDIKTPAVFGGLYYDITEQITISAEARNQWDKVISTPFVIVATPFSFSDGPALGNTFQSFAPRVTLDYKPTDDITFFALFSRGYRPGSFNSRFLTLTPQEIAEINRTIAAGLFVDEEHIDNFEVGVKSRLWEDRAQIGVSAYMGKIYDLQVSATAPVTSPINGTVSILSATANLGLVKFHGVELEGALQATESLNLQGSFSWNYTEFLRGVCAQCINIAGFDNIAGNHLLFAPEFKGSLSATWMDELTADFDWFARADFIYEGKKYADQANFSWVRPRSLTHVRIGVQNNVMKLEAYVTNLFDNRTASSAGNTSFDRLTQLGVLNTTIVTQMPDKAAWGVRTSYNF
jgi:iron complex outermembrane receptor protein